VGENNVMDNQPDEIDEFAVPFYMDQLSDRIASELMVDRSGYAGQGHCIALYSFADERSIAHMCDYLNHWLTQDEKNFQGAVMQALMWIDEKRGTSHSSKYTQPDGLWTKWLAGDEERGASGLIWSVVGLDYLRTLVNKEHGESNGN